MKQIDVKTALKGIKTANANQLEQLRVSYLGRKGQISLGLRQIGKLPTVDRAKTGASLNQAKGRIEKAIVERQQQLLEQQLADQSQPSFDITAPGIGPKRGHLHPVAELQRELIQAFWQIGFSVAEGPEIETDWYNFEALNIPPGHPARDMQDTFYLETGAVPRTHTSSVQIRHMEKHQPPIRVIAPGNVYRNEDEDATHLWAFTQMEGLVVDEGISLADLKGTLLFMFRSILGEQIKIDLRPNFFPYVEPALEVHISCVICNQKDPKCRTCKGTGWIEMLGAGMVHPRVLHNVGIDPKRFSGFAFGGGLERIAAIKHRVPDIREFWRPNLKFLEQF